MGQDAIGKATAVALGCAMLAGCAAEAPPSNLARAEMLLRAIETQYRLPEGDAYIEYHPPRPEDRGVSTLWPVSELLSAANAILDAGGASGRDAYAQALRSVDLFHDAIRTPPAYASFPPLFGGGERFYDDNLWLGIDFVNAYVRDGDADALRRAEEVYAFIQSGWDDVLGGGIYWKEQGKDTKNTCSNGPAAVFALKLYRATGAARYLDFARSIYDWTRDTLRAPQALYWDHVRLDGSIDEAVYSYNTGTMMEAAVLLHEITGEEAYLAEAQALARAAEDGFAPEEVDGVRRYVAGNPWFHIVLLRGYIALYRVDGDARYIDNFQRNLDMAWSQRDEEGLIGADWSGATREDSIRLLDVACLVEGYALLHAARGGK